MSAAVSADHYSFPSGHASRVYFVAASVHFEAPTADPSYTFLDGWIRDPRDGDVKGNVVAAVWMWATVTAISRILLGRHYVLDVAAGACLGILEALFALRFLRFDLEQIFWRDELMFSFRGVFTCPIPPLNVQIFVAPAATPLFRNEFSKTKLK